MKHWIYILLVNLSWLQSGYAQVVPWTVVPTSVSQEIVLRDNDSTANYDYKFDTNGDAIGVFFDQSGTWVCGGYIVLDGINRTFLIYGNDGGDNGFQFNEGYRLRYWRKSQNCVIDQPFGAMNNAQYSTGGSDTIYVVGAWPTVVEFPKDYYCKYDPALVQLQVTNSTFANILVESIQPPLVNYNAVSGVIEDVFNVTSATYRFEVTTLDNRCLRSPSFEVTISDKLHLDPIIAYVQPTCVLNSGMIKIDTSAFANGTKPYAISLTDTISGSNYILPSGDQSGLPASTYRLVIPLANI